MSMLFKPGWMNVIQTPVPVLGPTPTNKQKKNKEYIEKNNQKRLDGAVFLSLFNETEVRNAVQLANGKYNNHATVKALLNAMIGSTEVITIDQGTHQDEDRDGGGFKLHFDARRPDNKCFHLYVGQAMTGELIIIEISYMDGSKKEEAHPI